MRLWRRGDRHTTTAIRPAGGPALDESDETDDLEALDAMDGLSGAGTLGGSPDGPVMLTLTTREQIEKAAAAEAAPKMVRVRPGRGAFGGTAGGQGCAR